MKKIPMVCMVLLALAVSALPVAAETVLATYDFDGSTVDQLPIGPDTFFLVDTEPSGNPDGVPDRLFTAGAGGAVADPFGPAGNKSAVLHNRPSPPTQPQMNFFTAWSDDPADFTNGKIEFDLYMAAPTDADGVAPQDEFWSYVNFRAGYGDNTRSGFIGGGQGDTAISVSFRQQLVLPNINASGLFNDGNGTIASSIVPAPETATHVEFRVLPPDPNDAFPNGSFELRLDGVLASWGGDPNVTQQPWIPMSALPPAASPGINMISFVGASEGISTVGAADVWFDNIKITKIPEPAAALLMLVGGVALGVHARRRCRRQKD